MSKDNNTIRLYFSDKDKKLYDAIKKLSKDEERSLNKTCKLVIKRGLKAVGYYKGE